jgi:hypothetical protein
LGRGAILASVIGSLDWVRLRATVWLDGRSAPWNQCIDLRHVISGSAVGEFDLNEMEMYPAFSEMLVRRS